MGLKHTYATKTQLETLVRRMHRTDILYYEAMEDFKKQFILVVLRDVNWNKSKAARILEVHRSTLVRILRELNIDMHTLRNTERCPSYSTGIPQKKTFTGWPPAFARRSELQAKGFALNALNSTAPVLHSIVPSAMFSNFPTRCAAVNHTVRLLQRMRRSVPMLSDKRNLSRRQ